MGSKLTDKNCDPFFAYVSKAYLQYSFEKLIAESKEDDTLQLSDELDKKTRKILKHADNKAAVRKTVIPKAKKLSVIIMLILSITTCVFAPVQAVQKAVVSTVLKWQDEFASIFYSADSPSALAPLPDIQINYLPDGYDNLIIDNTFSDMFVKCYENASQDIVYISVYPVSSPRQKSIDNEIRNLITVEFGDIRGIIGFNKDNSSDLVWEKDNMLFSISAKLSINELIKIAENIKY